MGDQRRHAPPPEYPDEEVTDEFVDAVLAQLKANRTHNRLHNRRPGDDDYRISSHAELAEVVAPRQKNFKSMLNRIIGPAKETTKAKPRVETSRYVGAIRDALGIEAPVTAVLEVRADRLVVLRAIATLTNDEFAPFEHAVAERAKKLPGRRGS